MPFGLRNAAQTFQRFIDEVLRGFDFVYTYIDDLLIASSSPEEHLQHLCLVLERLDKHGILINVNKSRFGVPELDIMGYHLDATGIRPLQEKVQVVREFPRPNTQRQLMGLVNFYHRFISNGATLLQPLYSLFKRTKQPSDMLEWTDNTSAAFHKVKDALADASLPIHPRMGIASGYHVKRSMQVSKYT